MGIGLTSGTGFRNDISKILSRVVVYVLCVYSLVG